MRIRIKFKKLLLSMYAKLSRLPFYTEQSVHPTFLFLGRFLLQHNFLCNEKTPNQIALVRRLKNRFTLISFLQVLGKKRLLLVFEH